jgi:hypothetical protein
VHHRQSAFAGYRALKQDVNPAAIAPTATAAEEAHPSFLYGCITTVDGVTYKGRLRWGGGEEAFWGDYFNGAKNENPWVVHVSPERLPKECRPIEIFGVENWRGGCRNGGRHGRSVEGLVQPRFARPAAGDLASSRERRTGKPGIGD